MDHRRLFLVFFAFLWNTLFPVQAAIPSPLLGPAFPPPSSPSNAQAIQNAIQMVNNALNAAKASGNGTKFGPVDFTATSFSLDVYSIHEPQSFYTHHWYASDLTNPSEGVSSIDSDTVYRIGSMSKLLMVYIYLLAVGDASFADPISKYIPEVAEHIQQFTALVVDEPFTYIDWESITIGSLASQLAGLPQELTSASGLDELLQENGFPPVQGPNITNCGLVSDDFELAWVPCNRSQFLTTLLNWHPSFLPFESPAYSNPAYTLLAYALEEIKSDTITNLFAKYLTQPLAMSSTTYSVPQSKAHAVIPLNDSFSHFSFDLRDIAPAGGFYSSTNDLRKMGVSILNSTKLSPAQTRRWLKPHSLTADLNSAVGAPWEILQAPLNRTSWMYTKSGSIGAYSSRIVYLPDWDVGITVLTAFTEVDSADILASLLAAYFVPALEESASEEAAANIAGTYTDSASGSTLVLSSDNHPGLNISTWTFGNESALNLFGELFGVDAALARLFPTKMTSKNGTQAGWQATVVGADENCDAGSVEVTCESWLLVDFLPYHGVGVDEFLVETDPTTKKATSVTARAFDIKYTRQ